jgi:hypothetical protein
MLTVQLVEERSLAIYQEALQAIGRGIVERLDRTCLSFALLVEEALLDAEEEL